MDSTSRPLAIVTGASSGIGYNLAKCCAENGFDLVVAADQPLDEAVMDFRRASAMDPKNEVLKSDLNKILNYREGKRTAS